MKLKFAALALLAASTLVSAQTAAPAAPDPDLQKALVASSNSLFTAYQQMDQALFLSLIAPDFVFISKWGILAPDQLAQSVQGCAMTSFKISEPQARQLTPDSAVLMYKVHQSTSCNGKPEPTDLYLTDTFVRRGKDWLLSVHTQTSDH